MVKIINAVFVTVLDAGTPRTRILVARVSSFSPWLLDDWRPLQYDCICVASFCLLSLSQYVLPLALSVLGAEEMTQCLRIFVSGSC